MNPTYFITQPELAKALGVRNQAIAMQAGKLALEGFRTGNRTGYSPSIVRQFLENRGFTYPKQVLVSRATFIHGVEDDLIHGVSP